MNCGTETKNNPSDLLTEGAALLIIYASWIGLQLTFEFEETQSSWLGFLFTDPYPQAFDPALVYAPWHP